VSVVANVAINVDSRGAVGKLRQVQQGAQATERAVGGLGAAIGKLATAFGVIQAARFVFVKTAEIESQSRSLAILAGSAQKAGQIIQELQQLGAVTPFTSTELIDSAKRLQAFGVEADKVVETTRRLADASGATGAELSGLVTAYGQVQAKGRLQGEELLQFQERGIALQEELRKMYGMTGEEFQKALSKGQVSAKAVEVALANLTSTGGKYANGAIAQSDTLQGRLSTLQDGVEALARRIGQVLSPALKAIFNQAIAVVDAINAALAAGRGGGFTRNVAGARQFLNIGATSQAVDNIAKGIGQVSSQKNKSGIQQNLQALQQYQRLLQSVRPEDVNQKRALALQGQIFTKIDQNQAALKQLQAGAKQTDKLFTPPLIGAAPAGGGGGRAAGGGAKKGKEKQERESQLADILAANGLFRSQQTIAARIAVAEVDQNKAEAARLQHIDRSVQLLYEAAAIERSNVPLDERQAQLRGVQDKLAASTNQYEREIAIEKIAQVKAAGEQLQKMQDEQALLQGRLAGNEAEVMLNQQIRDLKKEFPGLDEAAIRSTIQQTEALKKQIEAAEQMKQIYTDIGMSIKDGVVGAIQGAIDGTKSLQEVASDLLLNIANKLLDVAVNLALFGAMSGTGTGGGLLGGLFKARAKGGPVSSGQTYMVGERGPELFVPGRSGTIVANDKMGGGNTNVVVNVDAKGSSVEGDEQGANQLGRVISAAVQSELIKQQRPGGILAR
jgi:tape measure domain-containing protein